MPLLGKKSYKPSPLPKDLKSEEEVFVIKETNEVFRSYDEYVNRVILYRFQVWSCQITGKTNLKYEEAVASEEQALKRLENFPSYFEKPVLQIVHHSLSGLQALATHCYNYLEREFVENEPVEFCENGKWCQGRIFKVHQGNSPSSFSGNISSLSSSPSSDKENAKTEMPGSVIKKSSDALYDIKYDSTSDCIEDIQACNIRRLKKLPSVEMLKSFIRANTENAWNSGNSPWQIKTDMRKKYCLVDKLQDFSLLVNIKKMTSLSKDPTESIKSSEKPKKRVLHESAKHGKSKVNKLDPSQRKLDSFRASTGNIFKNTGKIVGTPSKQVDLVEVVSSEKKGDGKTPPGELHGTPVKCRLVLTPVKSPYKGISKSLPNKKTNVKGNSKTKVDFIAVEDDTDEVTIVGSKSQKTVESNKLRKSPKSGSSKKTVKGTEKPKEKPVKVVKSCRKLDMVNNMKENGHNIKKTKSEIKTKEPNSKDVSKNSVLLNGRDDSEDEFVSSSKQLRVTVTPVKTMQSAGKLKQTTLFDLTKKSEDEKAVITSLQIKAKKQKTLAEMFSAAIQNDKPRTLANLIKKTAPNVSSPSSLNLNLATPQQDLLRKKWTKHKERLERQLLQKMQPSVRSCKKQEDDELDNLKPLPPAKPVNIPVGVTAELYGDIVMLTEFVYTFKDLLLPKESLNISVDYLSKALVSGREGFPLLSRILVIFLQILLQERSTTGKEMGVELSEMPVTQHSATELSRLYLNSMTYSADKQLQGILDTLKHEELYNLAPEEKLKILVTLFHEVLGSDAFDDYMENVHAQAAQIRKQKREKQRERNDKAREEKEKRRKQKEEIKKQKEEDESKKQLKLDKLNKKEGEADPTCASSEIVNSNPASESSNKTDKPKSAKDVTKESEGVSDFVKAIRQRREDMANKHERKLQELKEREEKEQEEEWDGYLTRYQCTLRVAPIGCDRNNSRYWVFGATPGVYVQQGCSGAVQQRPSHTTEVSKETGVSEKVSVEIDVNGEETVDNDDIITVEVAKDETRMEINENKAQHISFPDIPYGWSCYNTVEDVEALLESLANQGLRESALKESLSKMMTSISYAIKRGCNNGKQPSKQETDNGDIFSSIKEDLVSIAESLVNGNLATLDHAGLEEYKQAVHEASCITDFASHFESLLSSVLPQFFQGIFCKDKAGSEGAKQSWVEEVKKAATVSRLHLLLDLFDSTVIWDLSAENVACKVCRLKTVGKTMILCDECNLGFHLQCLRPALSEVPEGNWSCLSCKPNVRQSRRSGTVNYKEDDGDEASEDSDSGSSSEDQSDHHEDCCHICRKGGDLVCCHTCPLVFHKDCHHPPLRNIPRGAWSCWNCRQPKSKKENNNMKKEGKRSTRKRSHSLSSEESGELVVSKRTRRQLQPKEVEGVARRGARRRAPVSIEDDDEEQLDSNVKSFYGYSMRRKRQQKVYCEGDSSDGGDGSASEENENRSTSRRKTGGRPKLPKVHVQRSTRNRRRVSDSSDDPADDEENAKGVQQETNQRASRRKTKRSAIHASKSFDESDESGHDISKKSGKSTRQAVNEKRSNKSSKPAAKSNLEKRGGKEEGQKGNEINDDSKKSNTNNISKERRQVMGNLTYSSSTKHKQKETRNTSRREVTYDNSKADKRRRAKLEMDACEKIMRDLFLHEDNWPFTEAVNLREVPDYLQFVTTPMDLGTIRKKLKCLEYPDVESFVADVRLVFSNSDKYNLETSDVGKAAKTLEKYFEELLEENLPNLDKQVKVKRK